MTCLDVSSNTGSLRGSGSGWAKTSMAAITDLNNHRTFLYMKAINSTHMCMYF